MLRRLILAAVLVLTAGGAHAASTFGGLPAASQPLGNVPTYVPLDQGTGCATSGSCTTVQSDALRLGQPIQVNCSTIISPFPYQMCIDTSVSPPVLREYIGSQFWALYSLSPSTGPSSSVPTSALTSPFTLGGISVTTTGTQLNYLNAATGVTGTGSVVLGTSPTILTPTITTPAITGGTITNSTLVGVTSTGSSNILPHVANNAALTAASTLTYPNGVFRDSVLVAGDAGEPLFFRASGSACSLNTGDGDVGSQVKSANNLCWLAQHPGYVSNLQFGITPSSSGASATNLTAMNNWSAAAFNASMIPYIGGADFWLNSGLKIYRGQHVIFSDNTCVHANNDGPIVGVMGSPGVPLGLTNGDGAYIEHPCWDMEGHHGAGAVVCGATNVEINHPIWRNGLAGSFDDTTCTNTASGTLTNSSFTITGVSSPRGQIWDKAMKVTDNFGCIPANTYIASATGTTITMSKSATCSVAASLTLISRFPDQVSVFYGLVGNQGAYYGMVRNPQVTVAATPNSIAHSGFTVTFNDVTGIKQMTASSITAASWSGGVASFTTNDDHGMSPGSFVCVGDMIPTTWFKCGVTGRSTYANKFDMNLLGKATNGVVTIGSDTIPVGSTSTVAAGAPIVDTLGCIPDGTTVDHVAGSSIVMTANATGPCGGGGTDDTIIIGPAPPSVFGSAFHDGSIAMDQSAPPGMPRGSYVTNITGNVVTFNNAVTGSYNDGDQFAFTTGGCGVMATSNGSGSRANVFQMQGGKLQGFAVAVCDYQAGDNVIQDTDVTFAGWGAVAGGSTLGGSEGFAYMSQYAEIQGFEAVYVTPDATSACLFECAIKRASISYAGGLTPTTTPPILDEGSNTHVTSVAGGLMDVQTFTNTAGAQYTPVLGGHHVELFACGPGANGGSAQASTAVTNGSVGSGGSSGGVYLGWVDGAKPTDLWMAMRPAIVGADTTIVLNGSATGTATAPHGNAGNNGAAPSTAEASKGARAPAQSSVTGRFSQYPGGYGAAGGNATLYSNAGGTAVFGTSGEGGSVPGGYGRGGFGFSAHGTSEQDNGGDAANYCSGGGGAISANDAGGGAHTGGLGSTGMIIAKTYPGAVTR